MSGVEWWKAIVGSLRRLMIWSPTLICWRRAPGAGRRNRECVPVDPIVVNAEVERVNHFGRVAHE